MTEPDALQRKKKGSPMSDSYTLPLCDICTGNIKNMKDEKGTFKILICTYHLELQETDKESFDAEIREWLN